MVPLESIRVIMTWLYMCLPDKETSKWEKQGYFVSICLHHRAFYQVFVYSVNKIGQSETSERELLCELIHFHTSVKRYTKNFK